MVTIAEVADRIGEHICEQGAIPERFKVIAYGVEILLGLLITCAIIVACGALVGLFQETCMVLMAALIMKFIIGGPHLSGFLRCVGLSAVLILLFAWGSQLVILSEFSVSVVLGLIGILGILLYAPLMTFDNDNSRHFQSRLRKAMALAVFGGVFGLYLLSNNLVYRLLFAGLLLSILNISPIGIIMTNVIEKITKRGGEIK